MMAEYYKCVKTTATPTATEPNPSKFPPPSEFQIMPALGTHAPMTRDQIKKMYGTELAGLLDDDQKNPFLVHDWRNDVVTIGHVPSSMVRDATNGLVDEPWPAQLNKAVWDKRLELHRTSTSSTPTSTSSKTTPLVVSIGQVVPHEVMGMANFNKNLFVGVGGLEAINLSHFIGAVYGMENMMGRAENPLRAILNRASRDFLQSNLDLWYVLTVVAPNGTLRGLFIGNTIECYQKACRLSMAVNFTMLDRSPSKMVVYLDPDEFHSTWLGNKAVYRTRMAIADGGELIVLAPGVRKFGEDDAIDRLIRKYGYVGTPKIMNFLNHDDDNDDGGDSSSGSSAGGNKELGNNLGAVAHLIHGSSEGRFTITYCPGPHLTREEIEGVGYWYASLEETLQTYNLQQQQLPNDGWHTNVETGEEFFFIKNPALGLWAVPTRFEQEPSE